MPERQLNYGVHISEKNRYIYFETPKVACSSVKATLIKNEIEESNLSMNLIHSKKDIPFLSPKEFGYDNFINALSSDKYYKFTFVRNPYSRVLSAFLSKFKWNNKIKIRFYRLNNIDSDTALSFSDFLEYLSSNVSYDMDPHWRPQYNQISGLAKEMDFIGRFDNFENDLGTVINKIFGTNAIALFDTRKELGQQETKSSDKIDEYYREKEFDLVSEIYKKDFLEFGYNQNT